MTSRRYPAAVDGGLAYVKANATAIHLLPAGTYADRAEILAASLGHKTVTAGSIFSAAIADATGGNLGRKLVSDAITDGVCTGDGTAAHWAVIASVANSAAADVALLMGDMTEPKAVTDTNAWTLGPVTVSYLSGEV